MTAPWTPAHHASTHKTKPVRLLELGNGPHGKTALLEFPEGWLRTIDLPAEADAYHPLFDELPTEERYRLMHYTKHPVVIHPDGRRTRQGALSFITEEVNRLGGWIDERRFDVPAEDYAAGYITGYRCAGELLTALQRGYGPHIALNRILEEVMTAIKEPYGTRGRAGAASAFVSVVEEALKFFAKHALHAKFIGERIASAEISHAYCVEQEAKEKAAFVERMKAAKAAKRLAAAAAAGVPEVTT